MRYRDKFMLIGTTVVLLALLASDPDSNMLQHMSFFGSTIAGLLIFSKAMFGIAFCHYGRKALMDYESGDFETAAKKALESPTGAGLLCLSIAILFLSLAMLVSKNL